MLNVARGPLIVDEDLEAALDSGKVGGAALDVFRSEPITEHPLFGRPNVIVTPHLGASTAEATDRAGFQAAEQVVAALTGGVVSSAVNVPAVAAEDMEVLGPFLPLSRQLGRLAMALGEGSSVDRVDVELLGRIAERDTRPLAVEVLLGVLTGHTEEEVNAVNAPVHRRGARDRADRDARHPGARLLRPRARDRGQPASSACAWSARRSGSRHRPHLLEAWGHRFNLQLEEHIALFRYRDVPGHDRARRHLLRRERHQHLLGRGRPRARGRRRGPRGDGRHHRRAVPDAVVEQIVGLDGFVAGRAVALG